MSMMPTNIPCFNQPLVEEIHHAFHLLDEKEGNFLHEESWQPVNYCVIASRHPKVFNLGGDLVLFMQLIREKNKEALMHYARLCIEAIYTRLTGFNAKAITLSVIQGDALGGGFEFALSSNIIIAEQGTRFGFPEILFNMFPGMGAYSLLSRKVGMRIAEDLITSGNTYKAEDLHKLGIIDIIAPVGEGKKVANDLMRKQEKHVNSLKNIYRCRQLVNPVSNTELQNVISAWVDAAMLISEKDLTTMRRLANSQRYQQEMRILPKSSETLYSPDLAAA
jgi:DSF synthase